MHDFASTCRFPDASRQDVAPCTNLHEHAPTAQHFLGRSPAAASVRSRLTAFAASDANVMLVGPTGTGHELAARILHQMSPRSSGPFVAIDLGSIADGLADSELFGHVRGSFTGASNARRGLIAEANGGTLFLDEITNASLSLQGRLLRAIEEREIRPVGADRSEVFDVRIVAATNRDLVADTRAGRFRQDLCFRLDVLRLRLPPLDERREDVPMLARHLLAKVSGRTGRSNELTPSAEMALASRSWPGSVRELRNAIEHAAALAGSDPIAVEHLPEVVTESAAAGTAASWDCWFAQTERAFLLARLGANGWNRSRTARELRISRQALYDRIDRYGLRPTISSPVAAIE